MQKDVSMLFHRTKIAGVVSHTSQTKNVASLNSSRNRNSNSSFSVQRTLGITSLTRISSSSSITLRTSLNHNRVALTSNNLSLAAAFFATIVLRYFPLTITVLTFGFTIKLQFFLTT